ncbi:MAG: hypothetical protein RL497_2872 [Pseudomonadota bacterium]|jgi:Transposase IS66 family
MAKRTPQQCRELIQKQSASGQTATAFCAAHGINPKYFSLQKNKLYPRDKNNSKHEKNYSNFIALKSPTTTEAISLTVGELNINNYAGFVQVDGYAAYEQMRGVLVGCMAHARRKFVDAQEIQPKGKVGKADWAINHLPKLYIIEKHIKHKTIAERYAVRQAQARFCPSDLSLSIR